MFNKLKILIESKCRKEIKVFEKRLMHKTQTHVRSQRIKQVSSKLVNSELLPNTIVNN